jgi:hypothetical protein
MTGPGTGFGDRRLFGGAVVLVTAFLIAAHSFIERVELPKPPAERGAEKRGDGASPRTVSLPSASK